MNSSTVSPEMAAKIDEQVKKITDEGYKKAVGNFKKLRAKLDVLAEELLQKETFESEEFEKLIGSKPVNSCCQSLIDKIHRFNQIIELWQRTSTKPHFSKKEAISFGFEYGQQNILFFFGYIYVCAFITIASSAIQGSINAKRRCYYLCLFSLVSGSLIRFGFVWGNQHYA